MIRLIAPTTGYFAVGLGALANCIVLAVWLMLAIYTPPGTAIRPMGVTMICFLAGLNALVLGVPLSLLAFWQRRWWVGALALTLNLTPWPLELCVSEAVVAVMGYTLKE